MARETLPENMRHEKIFVCNLPFPDAQVIKGFLTYLYDLNEKSLPVFLKYWKQRDVRYDINRKKNKVLCADKRFVFNVTKSIS